MYYSRETEAPDETMNFKEVKAETTKSWKLTMDDGEEVWFPKSQCQIHKQNKTITMPGWMYKEKFPNG